MRILVTGGTGTLGRAFVSAMHANDDVVRVASRRARPDDAPPSLEWAQMDLSTGKGIGAAVDGVEVVLHAATVAGMGSKAVDVGGTRRLLQAARKAGADHVVYPSIVGIDQIPLRYYRLKRQAEDIVRNGGVPWTILRATQFYPLIDQVLSVAARLPVMLLPTDFLLQPVDVREVAERLVQRIRIGAGGRLPDFGGPGVHTAGELAQSWMEAKGHQKRVLRLPLPGRVADAFRRGENTAPKPPLGTVTWQEWLRERE